MPKLEKLHSSDWGWHKLGGGREMTPNGEKVEMLKKEIELVMERNKNETYLKSLLTRALVLEKLHNK